MKPDSVKSKKKPDVLQRLEVKPLAFVTKAGIPIKGVSEKSIRTSIFEMHMGNDGILYKYIIPDCHIDIDSAVKDHEETVKLVGNKKMLVLYHLDNFFTITPEAIENTIKTVFSTHRKACALVTTNIGLKSMIGVMNMNENKRTKTPVKLFSTDAEARKWLLTFKKTVK